MKKALTIFVIALSILVSAFTFKTKAEDLPYLPNSQDEINAFGADITSINGLVQYLKNGGTINFFNPSSASGDYVANLVSDFLASNVPLLSQDAWKTIWQVGTFPYGQSEAIISGDVKIESGVDKIKPTWDKFVNWITGSPQSLVVENKPLDLTNFVLPTTPSTPTYSVDSETLELCRQVYDINYLNPQSSQIGYWLFFNTVQQYGSQGSNFSLEHSVINTNDDRNGPFGTTHRLMLYHNTTNNTNSYYIYNNNTWELLRSGNTVLPRKTGYGFTSGDAYNLQFSSWDFFNKIDKSYSSNYNSLGYAPNYAYVDNFNKFNNSTTQDGQVSHTSNFVHSNDLKTELKYQVGVANRLEVFIGDSLATALPVVSSTPQDPYSLTLPPYNPFTLQRPLYIPTNQPINIDLGIDLLAFINRIKDIIEQGLKNTITWADIQDLLYYDDPRNFDDDPNNDILPVWTITYVRNDLDSLAIENYGDWIPKIPYIDKDYLNKTGIIDNLSGATTFYYNIFSYTPVWLRALFGGVFVIMIFAIFIKRD